MALTSWNTLSIVELIVYTPALLVGIFLWVRHGHVRDSTWPYLIGFAIISLAGASLQLGTIGAQSSTALGLQTAVARLFYIRLSPLLLAPLGLLRRINYSINKTHRTRITPLHLRLIRIPVLAALVLVIVGVCISAADLVETGVYTVQATTEVGVVLFVAVFAITVLIAGILIRNHSHVEVGERRLLIAVAASLPLILVRLIYTILVTFSSVKEFSIIDGSVVAMACATNMEEIVVVIIYEAVGLTLRRVPKEVHVKNKCSWRGRSRVPTAIQPSSADGKGAVPGATGIESIHDGGLGC